MEDCGHRTQGKTDLTLRLGIVILGVALLFSRLFQIFLQVVGISCTLYLFLMLLNNSKRSRGHVLRTFPHKKAFFRCKDSSLRAQSSEQVQKLCRESRERWGKSCPEGLVPIIDEIIDKTLRDFLWCWYEEVSGGRRRFLYQLRSVIYETLLEISVRVKQHDWIQLSVDNWVSTVTNHIKECRLAHDRAIRQANNSPAPLLPSKQEQSWRTARLYRSTEGLHPALKGIASSRAKAPTEDEVNGYITQHLRNVLETRVLPAVLSKSDISSNLFKLLARETVGTAALGYASCLLAQRDFCNQAIEYMANSVLQERDLVEKLRENGAYINSNEFLYSVGKVSPRGRQSAKELLIFDEDLSKTLKGVSLWELLQLKDTLAFQIEQLSADLCRYKGSSYPGSLVSDATAVLKSLLHVKARVCKRINEVSGSHKETVANVLPSLGMVLTNERYLSKFLEFMAGTKREGLIKFWLDIDELRRTYRLFDSTKKVTFPAIVDAKQTLALYKSVRELSVNYSEPDENNLLIFAIGHRLVSGMASVSSFCQEALDSVSSMESGAAGEKLASVPFPSLTVFLKAQESVFRVLLDNDYELFIKSPSFAECAINLLECKGQYQHRKALVDLTLLPSESAATKRFPRKAGSDAKQRPVGENGAALSSLKKSKVFLGPNSAIPYSPLGNLFKDFFPNRAAGKKHQCDNCTQKDPELDFTGNEDFQTVTRELGDILNSNENAFLSVRSVRSNQSQLVRRKRTIPANFNGKGSSLKSKRKLSRTSQSAKTGHRGLRGTLKRNHRRSPNFPESVDAVKTSIPVLESNDMFEVESASLLETPPGNEASEAALEILTQTPSLEDVNLIPTSVQKLEIELMDVNKRLQYMEKEWRKLKSPEQQRQNFSKLGSLAKEIDELRSRRLDIYEMWYRLTVVSATSVLVHNGYTAQVTDFYEKQEDGHEFIAYVVEVRPSQRAADLINDESGPCLGHESIDKSGEWRWLIWRRYSEFFTLYQTLKAKYGSRYMDENEIILPSKRLPGLHHIKRNFIERRRQGLDSFLRSIYSNNVLANCNSVRLFLVQSLYFEMGGLPGEIYAAESPYVRSNVSREFEVKVTKKFPNDASASDAQVSSGGQSKLKKHVSSNSISSQSPSISNSGLEEDSPAAQLDPFTANVAPASAHHPRRLATDAIVDVLIEVFEWKKDFNQALTLKKKSVTKGYWSWFRRQAVLTLLKQFTGGMIERRIRDSIAFFFCEGQLINYLTLVSERLWPDGRHDGLAQEREQSTTGDSAQQLRKASEKLNIALLVWLGPIIGKSHARRGADNILCAFQNPVLNRNLILNLFDQFIAVVFPE